MSFDKNKLYMAGDGYYNSDKFATEAEAINSAKQRSALKFEDTPVWKAIQLVNAPIPKDIIVETL